MENKISKTIDSNLYSIGFIFDIKLLKAFETVDHKILLSKLEDYKAYVGLASSGSPTIYATENSQCNLTDANPNYSPFNVEFCKVRFWVIYFY